MFNIDFSQLIQFLLPANWRKPRFLAWLKLILSHLNKVYDEFVSFRTLMLYNINFTGQVMYLEKMLNDSFEASGIYISEIPGSGAQLYLFNQDEDFLPIYCGNLFTNGEIYEVGEWVVFDNFWYEYSGTGNGLIPTSDPNASKRSEIETYLGNLGEISADEYDFIVNIPASVYASFSSDDILKLKKIVEYYKLAEMRYILKTY